MKELTINHHLEGVEIRFPGNGPTEASPQGKLYQLLFWVCIFSPMFISTEMFDGMGLWMLLPIVGITALMYILSLRPRKLKMMLDDRAVTLSSPRSRRTIALQDIDGVEIVTDSGMSLHYMILKLGYETVVIDALLKKEDATWLKHRIETSIAAQAERFREEQVDAQPPDTLKSLMNHISRASTSSNG